jgi:cbb3-type cytochrome oxidase maturation protein
MEILFILIGFSLLVAIFFLSCFFWAVKTGQYEDRYTPAIRMLFDEQQSKINSSVQHQEKKNYAE